MNTKKQIILKKYSLVCIVFFSLSFLYSPFFAEGVEVDSISIPLENDNNPPSLPNVSGPSNGFIGIRYEYSFNSTDEDNSTISFIVDWGDGTTITSEYIPVGNSILLNHSWSTAGWYTLIVQATDNQTMSEQKEILVLINAIAVGSIGYVIDDNNDTIYDEFHNKSNAIKTPVERFNDKLYLIDENGDDSWEYYYNVSSGILTPYFEDLGDEREPGSQILFLGIIGIGLFLMALIVYLYKTGYIH